MLIKSRGNVLCIRRLGLAIFDERFGAGTGAILLDNVNCRGNESSVANCQHAAWGSHNCGHHEDVSIICVDEYITGRPKAGITTTIKLAIKLTVKLITYFRL